LSVIHENPNKVPPSNNKYLKDIKNLNGDNQLAKQFNKQSFQKTEKMKYERNSIPNLITDMRSKLKSPTI
jgi:hypothetical protein